MLYLYLAIILLTSAVFAAGLVTGLLVASRAPGPATLDRGARQRIRRDRVCREGNRWRT